MTSLLLSTLAMMGLTFAIGFFVAGVIKLIAVAADSLDFYSSHHEELLRLRRLKKIHQKVIKLIKETPPEEEDPYSDGRGDFRRGINKDSASYHGYYHGVSPGSSEMNLLDYYYPEDTHMVYLQKEEEMMHHSKRRTKKLSANKK